MKRGDFVRIEQDGVSKEAMVVLASANGDSLAVMWHDATAAREWRVPRSDGTEAGDGGEDRAMTHMRPMSEDEGEFTSTSHRAASCRQCKSGNVTCKTWESSDGGWEDYKYICEDCGYVWWVEGIDA